MKGVSGNLIYFDRFKSRKLIMINNVSIGEDQNFKDYKILTSLDK